ncbi:Ger(x)C family spore germination protein [Pseudalkalibacillus sp. A8]|uniref:Ger(x)C family spore germination protein n=1 Tax=Pseudalkalibacillus sp. A8 TaxID=3382641 RepID=UPI0038B6931D
MTKTKLYLIVFIVFPFFLTGCWDQIEIEDRGFIIGVAIDLFEGTEEESDDPQGEYQYKGTWQYVVPGEFSQGTSGQSGGGSQKPYDNVSTISDSLLVQARNLSANKSRPAFAEHMQVIIISDKLAKTQGAFENILDLFIRDDEMRRGMIVMISEGEASPILDMPARPESLPALNIKSISENIGKNPKIHPPVRVGAVHQYLIGQNSFTIPKVAIDGKAISMTGAAVFQGNNNQMIDFISGDVTEGLNFITGKYKGGFIKAKVKDQLVVYDVRNARSIINVDVKNKENIHFNIEIQTEGIIGESFVPLDYSNSKMITKVENAIEKEVERKVLKTIHTFQKDLKADSLGLGGHLQGEDHKTWNRIKQNWDQGEHYFSKSTINVQVKAFVRNSGAVIESSDQ